LNEDREEFKDDNAFNHGNLGFDISEEEGRGRMGRQLDQAVST
jgi:hypothetical protein